MISITVIVGKPMEGHDSNEGQSSSLTRKTIATTESETVVERPLECTTCGFFNKRDQRFCGNCQDPIKIYWKVSKNDPECQFCEAPNKRDQKFCSTCRKLVSNEFLKDDRRKGT
ncbi:uncharacterized protein LOC126839549 [Adelges cooleyi]|uniref:uncharacterized protein LOC126839549 n=1 Tax=Adelges cooleyi TaxID=133065 RepID=UPI0021806CB5|nr:uncharacterized protein LOC126839549 [Adelges cooleyi]